MKPEWHDRPTAPGLWVMLSYGDDGSYDMTMVRFPQGHNYYTHPMCKYYGPMLPPDTKEEK